MNENIHVENKILSIAIMFLMCIFLTCACSEDESGASSDGDSEGDSDSTADSDADSAEIEDGESEDGDEETLAEIDAEMESEIEIESDGDTSEGESLCADASGVPESVLAERSIEYLRDSGFLMERCLSDDAKTAYVPPKSRDGEPQTCQSYRDCLESQRCVEQWNGLMFCVEMESCTVDEDCSAKADGHCIDDGDGNSICVYDECGQDSDCSRQSYGKCIRNEWYPYSGMICVYHDCQSDDDCQAEQVCFCRDSTSREKTCGGKSKMAVCVESCRSSDECGEGRFCISAGQALDKPSMADCSSGMQAGAFRCTGADDRCGCCSDNEGCVYDSSQGHFVCKPCERYEGDCPE